MLLRWDTIYNSRNYDNLLDIELRVSAFSSIYNSRNYDNLLDDLNNYGDIIYLQQ